MENQTSAFGSLTSPEQEDVCILATDSVSTYANILGLKPDKQEFEILLDIEKELQARYLEGASKADLEKMRVDLAKGHKVPKPYLDLFEAAATVSVFNTQPGETSPGSHEKVHSQAEEALEKYDANTYDDPKIKPLYRPNRDCSPFVS